MNIRLACHSVSQPVGCCLLAVLISTGGGCGNKPRSNAPDFSKSNVVGLILGDVEKENGNGLQHIFHEKDGLTTPAEVNDELCRCLRLEQGDVGYLYFKIDPTFKKRGVRKVRIEAEYFDGKPGILGIEYDASESKRDTGRIYTGSAQTTLLSDSKQWRTVSFSIEDATFRNGQNSRSDFRLWVRPPDICVRRVTVSRVTK